MKPSPRTSVIVALASTLAYVACSSDDEASTSGTSGGSAGMTGKAGSAGSTGKGGSSTGGSSTGGASTGGTSSSSGGQSGAGGEPGSGGASAGGGGVSAAGAGGEAAEGGAGGESAGGASGAGGAGGAPAASAHPDCPQGTYVMVEGTASNDDLTYTPLTYGDDYVDALAGNDTIHASVGNDCYFGNDGDDRLEHGVGEDGVNYLIGGSGADDFVMILSLAHAVITDFSSADGDAIHFVKANFGLSGAEPGLIPTLNRYLSAADVEEGDNAGSCNESSPCIVYDQTDGQILYDADGQVTGSTLDLVAVIEDYASYTHDWSDFILE